MRELGGDRFEVFSAGTVATKLHPLAVRAMAELGMDISRQRSKRVELYQGQRFDEVITVCDEAADACPVFPGAAHRLHWSLPDPSRARARKLSGWATFRCGDFPVTPTPIARPTDFPRHPTRPIPRQPGR